MKIHIKTNEEILHMYGDGSMLLPDRIDKMVDEFKLRIVEVDEERYSKEIDYAFPRYSRDIIDDSSIPNKMSCEYHYAFNDYSFRRCCGDMDKRMEILNATVNASARRFQGVGA